MRTLVACGVVLGVLAGACPAQSPGLSLGSKVLVSRLQQMGHGYHTEAEWNELFGEIERQEAAAREQGNLGEVVEIGLIEAMVYSDMQRDYRRALAVLQELRDEFGAAAVPNMKKVYVKQAEVLSKLGDEQGIVQLIAEFKRSPAYDPENYSYTGGQGRDVPLAVTRPAGRGSDSVSVSAMEMYRTRARYAPGREFPPFEATTLDGKPFRLADWRGKVVLVDFWLRGWDPWRSELPNLVALYRAYRKSGFEIVGVSLARDTAGLADFLKEQGVKWPQVAGDTALSRKLGIFGEATSFLLARDGTIVERDLRGADLSAAVRRALGEP